MSDLEESARKAGEILHIVDETREYIIFVGSTTRRRMDCEFLLNFCSTYYYIGAADTESIKAMINSEDLENLIIAEQILLNIKRDLGTGLDVSEFTKNYKLNS